MENKKGIGYERGGNGFTVLTNDNLDCHDCVLKIDDNEKVMECHRYDTKPNHVINGGKCDEKIKNI